MVQPFSCRQPARQKGFRRIFDQISAFIVRFLITIPQIPETALSHTALGAAGREPGGLSHTFPAGSKILQIRNVSEIFERDF